MNLRFIQRFLVAGGSVTGPRCEGGTDCHAASIGSWADEENKGHYYCDKHRVEAGAPPMIEGCDYAPTNSPMSGWVYRDGVYVDKLALAAKR